MVCYRRVRLVLDTSIVVAGLRSRNGAANAILRRVAKRELTVLASPPLFLEYEDLLLRAEQRLAHGLSPEQVEDFLAALAFHIEPVQIYFRWRPQLVDPSDEIVLETAINGKADAIITHNFRHFSLAPERFRLKVLRPGELLRSIR